MSNLKCSIEPGIKLAEMGILPDVSEEELLFLKQLGVDYIEGKFPGKNVTYKDILEFRRKVEAAGIRLFSAFSIEAVNSVEIQLGLPGREYSDEELWDNYADFIKKILPVAEDAGVRLALHPCDPPVSLRGVAQIFRSAESFKRAMEIAGNSEYSGICFCVGTWAEMSGPDGGGEDITGAIRYFGKIGRIFKVHFRNVSSPLPRFHETFVDNGYVDMYRVMRALREAGFNGTIGPDHVPDFKDEKRIGSIKVNGTCYTIGYMRALLERVNEEFGDT